MFVKDYRKLKRSGNVVQFPETATKQFVRETGLDLSAFDGVTPADLELSFNTHRRQADDAIDVLMAAEKDGPEAHRYHVATLTAVYEMLQSSIEWLEKIEAFLEHKGYAYEISQDGYIEIPSLDPVSSSRK